MCYTPYMLNPELLDTRTMRCLRAALFALCCVLLMLPARAYSARAAQKTDGKPDPATRQNEPPARKIDSYTITQRGDRYRVNITYPNVGNAAADAELAIWARDQASTFTQSVQMIPAPDPMPYELHISYEAYVASSRVLSVVFFISTVMGGTHPEPGMATFVYEKTDGRRLSYADLFLKKEGFLEKLSELCGVMLSERLGDKAVPWMLKAGTAPDRANFDLFALAPEGLRIYFPPYQVAPYSEGYLSVTVPLAQLAEFKPQKSFWDQK